MVINSYYNGNLSITVKDDNTLTLCYFDICETVPVVNNDEVQAIVNILNSIECNDQLLSLVYEIIKKDKNKYITRENNVISIKK